MRLETGYLSLPRDTSLVESRLSGTYAPHPSVALRLRLPLDYVDAGAAGSAYGTSDLSARVLVRAWDHARIWGFIGVELFFPTAADRLPHIGTSRTSNPVVHR